MRIAVVMNMIAPYTTPVFERLNTHPDCELLVIYETPMEPDRKWRAEISLAFEHVVLDSRAFDLSRLAIGSGFKTRFDTYLYVPKRPLAPLTRFRPDVVIGAGSGIWSSPANVAAFLARARRRWAFVPWWGSFRRKNPTWPRRLAEPWVRAFVRAADAWMAYGTRAARDLVELGADPGRTVIAPIVAARTGPPVGAKDHRHPEGFRYLFVGRLIERKGIDVLLDAFRRVDGGELWIVGDGPLRSLAEAAAASDPRILVCGHLEGRELADIYARASVLVLPSLYEVWGLVVDEALAHGVPAIATEEVGSAADLLDVGVNGLIVPPGSSERLAEAMRAVAQWSPEQRQRCARRSQEKLEMWSIDRAVDGFLRASALAADYRRPSVRVRSARAT
jgi:glycosyltransferase involved in cell wall biosynthesis